MVRVNHRGAYIEADIIAMKLREWFWPESLPGHTDNDDWEAFDSLLEKDVQYEEDIMDAKINEKIVLDEILEPFEMNGDMNSTKPLKTVGNDDDFWRWNTDENFYYD